MDTDIVHFLKVNYILSLATFDGKFLYNTPLFYLFFDQTIFFLSDIKTKHSKDILKNSKVAVSIYHKTKNIKQIKGIQLLGNCELLKHTNEVHKSEYLSKIYKLYLKKFSAAKNIPSYLWAIYPYWIKFTNNEIHFGYKKIWKKER